MRIQLVTAAERPALNLSEAQDFLKISHGDEDAMIAGFIRASTEACESFTGRKLIKQQWCLTLNDWAEEVIQLPLSPVISVDRIEVMREAVFQEIAAADYLLDRTSHQAKILPASGIQWITPDIDVEGIKITLSAGFGDNQNDLPHDIRLGLLHWIAGAYDNMTPAGNQAVPMAEKLWQPYRRVAL